MFARRTHRLAAPLCVAVRDQQLPTSTQFAVEYCGRGATVVRSANTGRQPTTREHKSEFAPHLTRFRYRLLNNTGWRKSVGALLQMRHGFAKGAGVH